MERRTTASGSVIEAGGGESAKGTIDAMSGPRISVLLYVADDAPALETAMESLVVQTYSHWELLLAAGPRAGDVANRVQAWAGSDERIRVLPIGEDLGAGAALNFAAREARGELVAYLEPDAELGPDYLQQVAAVGRPFDVLVCGYDVVVSSDVLLSPEAGNATPPSPPLRRGGDEGSGKMPLLQAGGRGEKGQLTVATWDPGVVRGQLFVADCQEAGDCSSAHVVGKGGRMQ